MSANVEALRRRIRFTSTTVRSADDRIHDLTEEDVRTLLRRLPPRIWGRLHAVHFNHRHGHGRDLGYVDPGKHEIAVCALPETMSLSRFLNRRYRQTPRQFGARRREAWPRDAIRRLLLYGEFLHQLGHLQLVDPNHRQEHRRFALDHRAAKFAETWRLRLWARPFDHPDNIHNRPDEDELKQVDTGLLLHAG